MSDKFDRFVEALDKLCREHEIALETHGDLFVCSSPDNDAPLTYACLNDETGYI